MSLAAEADHRKGSAEADLRILRLVEAVRKLVREELIPAEEQVEETDQIPEHLIDRLKSLGLFGMAIPQAYGGLGLNMEQEVRVVFELGYAAPAFRSSLGSNNGIGSLGIVTEGTEEQRHKYLPRIASG